MANLVSNDNQIELGYQMQCWPFVLKESYLFMCIQFNFKKASSVALCFLESKFSVLTDLNSAPMTIPPNNQALFTV